jgi:hypothetical protein
MEHLFSPCTRYRDIAESQEDRLEELRGPPELLQELNLDVSTEDFLREKRAFTYADLYALLTNGNMVLWLTPHATVMRAEGAARNYFAVNVDEYGSCRYSFNADGKGVYVDARSSKALSEICDIVLRLLAVSVVHSVILKKWRSPDAWINSTTSLTYLMEQCQSLKGLTLEQIFLDENHCRVLGALSRPGLEITLDNCVITGAAATVLAQVLGHNQGPTKLDIWTHDNFVLADGLRGNSRLKSLILRFCNNLEVDREALAIACALNENKGLVVFDLR